MTSTPATSGSTFIPITRKVLAAHNLRTESGTRGRAIAMDSGTSFDNIVTRVAEEVATRDDSGPREEEEEVVEDVVIASETWSVLEEDLVSQSDALSFGSRELAMQIFEGADFTFGTGNPEVEEGYNNLSLAGREAVFDWLENGGNATGKILLENITSPIAPAISRAYAKDVEGVEEYCLEIASSEVGTHGAAPETGWGSALMPNVLQVEMDNLTSDAPQFGELFEWALDKLDSVLDETIANHLSNYLLNEDNQADERGLVLQSLATYALTKFGIGFLEYQERELERGLAAMHSDLQGVAAWATDFQQNNDQALENEEIGIVEHAFHDLIAKNIQIAAIAAEKFTSESAEEVAIDAWLAMYGLRMKYLKELNAIRIARIQVVQTAFQGRVAQAIPEIGSDLKILVAWESLDAGKRNLLKDFYHYLGEGARPFKNNADDIIIQSKDGLREIRFDVNDFRKHNKPHVHMIEYFVNSRGKKEELLNNPFTFDISL